MRFLLDEDVHPRAASIARGRRLDVTSVHELGRTGLEDEEQLRFAAREGRALVTRNRGDFLQLTLDFFATREPHAGLLIIPYSLPNRRPERIAAALADYADRYPRERMEPYTIDFLPSS